MLFFIFNNDNVGFIWSQEICIVSCTKFSLDCTSASLVCQTPRLFYILLRVELSAWFPEGEGPSGLH